MFNRSPSFLLLGAPGQLGEPIVSSLSKAYPESSIALLFPLVTTGEEAAFRSISPKQVRILQGDLNSTDVIANAVKETDITINLLGNESPLESVRYATEGLRWRNAAEGGIGRGFGNVVYASGDLTDLNFPYGEVKIVGNGLTGGLNGYDLSALPYNHQNFNQPELRMAPNQVGYALKSGPFGYLGVGGRALMNPIAPVAEEVVQLCLKVVGWIVQPYNAIITNTTGTSSPLIQGLRLKENGGVIGRDMVFQEDVVSDGDGVENRRRWPFGWRRRDGSKLQPEGMYHHGKWISSRL